MELNALCKRLPVVATEGLIGDLDVSSVGFDSHDPGKQSLFCCIPGSSRDSHDFAEEAISNGAVALLCERVLPVAVPQLVVENTRVTMATAAAEVWGRPAESLTMAGVTGTNGKTTVTHMLASIMEKAGRATKIVGTLGGARTTPEAPVLQRLLAMFRDDGAQAVAVEVASHALVQHRVDEIVFDVAVFTNLTQDHLDYHGTMDEYFNAKATLFTASHAALGVVNRDDSYGRRLLERAAIPMESFGRGDIRDVEVGIDASSFTWDGTAMRVGLGGEFNVLNALAAGTAARALGIVPSAIAEGLSSLPPVAGRFEAIDAGQPFALIVDFAHTPDGLSNILQAARQLAERNSGRVLIVFGCGGERDRTKRPQMGAIAAKEADVAILTSDNPRSEDPQSIAQEVSAGAPDASNLVVELDRASAISHAVNTAREGDVVIIAGKGHETGQDFGNGRVVPFDDRLVAKAAAEGWRAA